MLLGRDGYLNKIFSLKPMIIMIMLIIIIVIILLFSPLQDPDLILNKKTILSPGECIEN